MKKSALIFIMGVSGSGKNTMLHLLAQRNPNIKEIISYKTRPLRPNEVNHVDFHHIKKEDFEHYIHNGLFLEYTKVYGGDDYYGTKRSDIIDGLREGHILIKEIDMQGMIHVAKNDPELFRQSFRIFLDLSEDVMVRRITSRAPISNEDLHRRLLTAVEEKTLAKEYASVILPANGTIEEVYALVNDAVHKFLQS